MTIPAFLTPDRVREASDLANGMAFRATETFVSSKPLPDQLVNWKVAESYEEAVSRVVAAAPDFTPAQRAKLTALMAGHFHSLSDELS